MNRSDILTMMMYGAGGTACHWLTEDSPGYESWVSYNRSRPSQLSKLKTAGLIEKTRAGEGWSLRLTENGRLKAIGGRDPRQRWGREWDGTWRFLMFDIPKGNDLVRRRLYVWLREHHLGCLQKSVWMSPDPLSDLGGVPKDLRAVAAVVAIDGQPSTDGSQTDADFVRDAWKFGAINEAYRRYIEFAGPGLPAQVDVESALQWIGAERQRWLDAVGSDPLLPSALLPPDYLGRRALAVRDALLRQATPLLMALEKV